MYSTCLFCHASLGANEVVEHFPVGRRLAFDAAKGRLWVVCAHCGRWNLTPLEERWEAIEECERAFRGEPLRAQTAQIGLARTREGLELIHIGQPLRPEFVSWRWARGLRARRLRALPLAIGGAIAETAGMLGGAAFALTIGGATEVFGVSIWTLLDQRRTRERIVARVRGADRGLHAIRLPQLSRMEFVPDGDGASWRLRVAHDGGAEELRGAEASQMAGRLLAWINRRGAAPHDVARAIDLLVSTEGPERFIRRAAELRWKRGLVGETFYSTRIQELGLSGVELLALEMATHEDAERAAIEGELAALAAAWRDAEEIAQIADELLLPEWLGEAMGRMKERG